MKASRYAQARRDFEELERISELHDQVDLDSRRLELMQNPNPQTACDMYESAIHLWFREHGVFGEVWEIASRYNIK